MMTLFRFIACFILIFILQCFRTSAIIPNKKSAFLSKLDQKKQIVINGDTVLIRPRWFVPDNYKIQYAGNIGFLSLGAGYQIKQRYEPTLLLGYLSQTFGNSSTDVITVSLKNSFRLNTKPLFECVTLKSGVSINWGYTNNTFSSLPEHYPDKYYFQNKIHLAPFWGAEVTIIVKSKSLKVVGFYFEFATLDAYLLECIRTDYVKLNDIWNLALGMTLYIH